MVYLSYPPALHMHSPRCLGFLASQIFWKLLARNELSLFLELEKAISGAKSS